MNQESRIIQISHTGKRVVVPTVEDAFAALKRGEWVWFNLIHPSQEDLFSLMEPLGLHQLSVEDCLDANQIPKLEDYPEYSFMVFNDFRYARGELSISEIDIFVGKQFLLTVSGGDRVLRPLLSDVDVVVEREMTSIKQGPAYLLHVLLDDIVDQKFIVIEAIEEALNHAEDAMLADVARFNAGEFLRLRRELQAVRKSLFHEREILVKICRKDCPFIPEKAIYFYRDIYDHLTKFFELTESSREVVSNLMEMHLSLLNHQMSKIANQTNMTVRRLTFITTVFMPLTLIAGIGGMSEWSMMTGPQNWKISYPIFLLLMALLGSMSYWILKRYERRNRD